MIMVLLVFVSSVAVCCFVLAVVVVVVSHILVTIAVRHPPLLGATFFGGLIYAKKKILANMCATLVFVNVFLLAFV